MIYSLRKENIMGVCLLGYKGKDLEKVKDWDGFVSPDGEFLKVTERGNMEAVHDEFAEIYALNKLNKNLDKEYERIQQNNPNYRSICLGYKDILIHCLGYVNMERLSDHLLIEVPDPSINGYKVTDAQFDTLARLVRINGDDERDLMQVFKYERKMGEGYQYRR